MRCVYSNKVLPVHLTSASSVLVGDSKQGTDTCPHSRNLESSGEAGNQVN